MGTTTMEQGETLGEVLKKARYRRGWSQTQMSDATGINIWSLRRWEQNYQRPSVTYALELAKLFGLPMEVFAKRD